MASPVDNPGTPEGSDNQEQEDSLTADLAEQDEDSSLLDTALGLGDTTEGDGEPPETPTEEQADNLLDESTEGVQVEEDPVSCVRVREDHCSN